MRKVFILSIRIILQLKNKIEKLAKKELCYEKIISDFKNEEKLLLKK